MNLWVERVRRWVPRPVRFGLQRFVSLDRLKEGWRAANDPDAAILRGDDDNIGSGLRLGITRNRAYFHTNYVRACREIGVPFQVIDLAADEWMETVRASDCAALLVWPDATRSPWSQLFKDRCRLIESELGVRVYPGAAECWPYENKYRLRDWLMATGIPHPRTWVFVERDAAFKFASQCDLPIVFKTGFGAAATGVRIVRRRSQLRRILRRAFGRGHAPAGHDYRDREWGRVLLQEYLPDVAEWRMVRIGDAYFGHPKGRRGEFHSGSSVVEWTTPGDNHLALLEEVTRRGGFRSMAVDIFETPDGRLLVNELQTVFGASTAVHQLKVDGKPGRLIRDSNDAWLFEPGDFARNACANARVLDLLELLGAQK